MNIILKQPITGMVDKSSNLELKLSDVYVGNKKILTLTANINIVPMRDIEHKHLIDDISLMLKKDEELLLYEKLEVSLVEGYNKSFDIDIELNNSQTEVHQFSLYINHSKKGLIDYSIVKDMITIPPIKSSKVFIRLDYYKRGTLHNFSYYTNSTNKVYLKTNNHNWKEISEGFTIDNKDLEGKVNYFQLYTTDNENTKSYSNVQRIVKSD